jgi:hypothetical protein
MTTSSYESLSHSKWDCKYVCRRKALLEDEGRPFGIGFQEQAPNHLKQLLSKVVVVSVEEKSDLIRQICIRKTNRPEPLLTRR